MFGWFKPRRKRGLRVHDVDDRSPLASDVKVEPRAADSAHTIGASRTMTVREGTFALGERLVVHPALTEAAFLEAVGQDASPSVHNGDYRSYVIPAVTLHGRLFRPADYFTDGTVTFVSLSWADPKRSIGDGWKDWSKEKELEVARADAVWVSSLLNGLGTMTDTYSFDWGTISSGYDDRSGGSSVTIRYR